MHVVKHPCPDFVYDPLRIILQCHQLHHSRLLHTLESFAFCSDDRTNLITKHHSHGRPLAYPYRPIKVAYKARRQPCDTLSSQGRLVIISW
ncbi:unnamed protein product [Linum trigynum]|uniref:Uncharacterized protein n=1 Tax=Linum trigynum TaxID=586398 RepID=A0AAV2E3T4_9ROSI